MAEQGYACAFAKKPVAADQHSLDHPDLDQGLVFRDDRSRPEAIAAVRACQSAGIGEDDHCDHALTATASRMMELNQTDEVLAFTGQELGRMNSQELAQAVEAGVVCPVAPEQKLRLVEACNLKLDRSDDGDGVNDAPALKQAGDCHGHGTES